MSDLHQELNAAQRDLETVSEKYRALIQNVRVLLLTDFGGNTFAGHVGRYNEPRLSEKIRETWYMVEQFDREQRSKKVKE